MYMFMCVCVLHLDEPLSQSGAYGDHWIRREQVRGGRERDEDQDGGAAPSEEGVLSAGLGVQPGEQASERTPRRQATSLAEKSIFESREQSKTATGWVVVVADHPPTYIYDETRRWRWLHEHTTGC